jgi:hypothetical protein
MMANFSRFSCFSTIIIFIICLQACLPEKRQVANEVHQTEIDSMLTKWHLAAAEADFDTYFELMDEDFVFIGTDASENWTKPAFAAYSKPYFDKGKAWKFTKIERHIYISNAKEVVWFDELLETSFKICRGSGVIERDSLGQWKIKQYILSMTIPNDKSNETVRLKDSLETIFIKSFKK